MKHSRFFRNLFVLSVACMAKDTNAQQVDSTFILGNRVGIHSQILQEERSYWVRLPEGYDTTKRYPVIYLLDGEMYFPLVATIERSIEGRGNNLKAIIIGVNNTDRTRDLTPTPAVSEKGGATLENSGKGEIFYKYLMGELIPQIEKTYKISTQRMLIGHSFGGLTAVNILVNHINSFDNYLILEPSLWWDNQKLLKTAAASIDTSNILNKKRIFWGYAGQHHYKDSADYQNLLKTLTTKSIPFQEGVYPKENHGSVFIPGLYDGLRYLWNIPQMAHKPRR